MDLPEATNPIWSDIVLGKAQGDFEFLAIQFFMGRAQLTLHNDSSPETVSRLASELHKLFASNLSHPAVQRDLAKITR